MGGNEIVYMSPEDAWLKYRQRDASGAVVEPVMLTKDLEHLVGEHLEQVTITRNGISLFNGKYRYRSPELMSWPDKVALASFDIEDPSSVVVQDFKGERFLGVPRVDDVPAYADHETLSAAGKERASANRAAKIRYSDLAATWLPKGRPVIMDAQARETARQMEEARAHGRGSFKQSLPSDPSEEEDFKERLESCARYELEHALEFI